MRCVSVVSRAVIVNLAATNPAKGGFVTAYPDG